MRFIVRELFSFTIVRELFAFLEFLREAGLVRESV